MATVFLRHRVKDYDAWRPHYDSDRPRRERAGLSEVAIFRNAEDGNDLLLVWQAESEGPVRDMIADEDLGRRMQEAGVLGRPTVWFADLPARPPTHPMPDPSGANVRPGPK